ELGGALATNEFGTVVVGHVLDDEGRLQGAVWHADPDGWRAPLLVGHAGSTGLLPASRLVDVSGDGSVAVGDVEEFQAAVRVRHAIAGSPGGPFWRLPLPAFATSSSAASVSTDGMRIAGRVRGTASGIPDQVALWTR